jgi:3-methyladenine DNA glycosylase AlkC
MEELKNLLSQPGKRKLPDISEFHYATTSGMKTVSDFNESAAAQDQVRRAYSSAIANAIYLENREKNTVTDDITKFLNQINKVGDKIDEHQLNKSIDRYKKRYQDGSTFVYGLDEKTDLPFIAKGAYSGNTKDFKLTPKQIKEYNTVKKEQSQIERDIHELQQQTLSQPTVEGEDTQILQEDPSSKIVNQEKVLGIDAFKYSKDIYLENLTKPFYVQKGDQTFRMSLAQAINENAKFNDGTSVAEAIREEIFARAFNKLGLDNIHESVLDKYYWEPLFKFIQGERTQEALKRSEELKTAYELNEVKNFITGISEKPGEYLSGSKDNPSGGLSTIWDLNTGDLAISIPKIKNIFEKAFESPDSGLDTQTMVKVLNARYFDKSQGKSVRLENHTNVHFKDLYAYLDKLSDKVIARETAKTDKQDQSWWESAYLNKAKILAIAKAEELNKSFLSPSEKNTIVKELIMGIGEPGDADYFPGAANDGKFSAKFREALSREGSAPWISLMNAIPSKEEQDSAFHTKKFWEARETGNVTRMAFHGTRTTEPWIVKLYSNSKNNSDANAISQQILNADDQAFQKAFGKNNDLMSKNLSNIIEEWIKTRKLEVDYITEPAQRFFTRRYKQLSQAGAGDPLNVDAFNTAFTETQNQIQNGTWNEPPENTRTLTPDEFNTAKNNAASELNEIIASSGDVEAALENRLLDSKEFPNEVHELNYASRHGGYSPLYNFIASYFPNKDAWDIALIRQGVFVKRQWTPHEINLWKEKYGLDPTKTPWMNEEDLANTEKKLQVLKDAFKVTPEKNPELFETDSEIEQKKSNLSLEEVNASRKNLYSNPSASNWLKHLSDTGDFDFAFSLAQSKRAMKGNEWNHVINKRGRVIATDKPLSEMNIIELRTFFRTNPNINQVGMYGLTPLEIDTYIRRIVPRDEGESQKFDKKLQSKILLEKMKEVANRRGNDLSTITIGDFGMNSPLSKLSNKDKKKFLQALKTGMTLDVDLEWTTDMPINAPGNIVYGSTNIANSVWNHPDVLNGVLMLYMNETVQEGTN